MRLLWIAFGVLVVDQATKVMVRSNMTLRTSIDLIGDWLKFTYTENPGMAFGIVIGSTAIVTALSIIATGLIIYYLYRVRAGYAPYTMSLAAVLGGALGNIVDRIFYGWIFDYGTLFEGRVVDFIHFNIWTGLVPESVPLVGGMFVALFPIFNAADIAICGGVAGILIFQKKFHSQQFQEMEAENNSSAPEEESEGPPEQVDIPGQSDNQQLPDQP